MATHGFAAQHSRDRLFFLAFVLLAWFAVYQGFAATIERRFNGTADYPAPWALEVHVWSFFGWMTLLTLQIGLIRFRRPAWHRTLGIGLLILVPVMAFTALAAEGYSQHFYAAKDPENIRFYIIPLTSVLMFVAVAAAAFATRHDPSAHKRLILIATAVILTAAFGRWFGREIEQAIGSGFWGVLLSNFGGVDLTIAAAMLYDQITRGRPHPVYWKAVPPVLLVQIAAAVIYNLPGWPPFGRWLLGI